MKVIKATLLHNYYTGVKDVYVYDRVRAQWKLNTGQYPGVSTDPEVIKKSLSDMTVLGDSVYIVFVDGKE